MTQPREEVHILLVDPADVLMTEEAFAHHKIDNPLHVVTDGAQALRFLRREGPHHDAPRPGLILLDRTYPNSTAAKSSP